MSLACRERGIMTTIYIIIFFGGWDVISLNFFHALFKYILSNDDFVFLHNEFFLVKLGAGRSPCQLTVPGVAHNSLLNIHSN